MGPGWQASSQHRQLIELIYSLEFPIRGVEVRRIVIAIIHTNHDTVKLGEFRHAALASVPLALALTAIDRVVADTKHPHIAQCRSPMPPHRNA